MGKRVWKLEIGWSEGDMLVIGRTRELWMVEEKGESFFDLLLAAATSWGGVAEENRRGWSVDLHFDKKSLGKFPQSSSPIFLHLVP